MWYQFLIRDVNNTLKNQREVFIKHYVEKYGEPKYPPIWVIIETLSLGSCSKLFSNTQSVSVRNKISHIFSQHSTVIESWIKTVTWIRNICAHHGRLWNRWLVDAPRIDKKEPLYENLEKNNRRFIVVGYILIKLLKEISPGSEWNYELYELFCRYKDFPGESMGFIKRWREDGFWQANYTQSESYFP